MRRRGPETARDGLRWLFGAAAALLVLVLANRLLQPLPVAAATATLGALIGLGLARKARGRAAAAGLLVGLAAGAAHHLAVHLGGRSPPPVEGLAMHLLAEAGVALVVAAVAIAVSEAVRRAA